MTIHGSISSIITKIFPAWEENALNCSVNIIFINSYWYCCCFSRCQCNLLGTDPNNAQCNEKGECFCKRNVIGASCDQCRVGYYGLEESNPYGCKQCFCSGHTSICRAAKGYAAFNLTTSFAYDLEGWTIQNEDCK